MPSHVDLPFDRFLIVFFYDVWSILDRFGIDFCALFFDRFECALILRFTCMSDPRWHPLLIPHEVPINWRGGTKVQPS